MWVLSSLPALGFSGVGGLSSIGMFDSRQKRGSAASLRTAMAPDEDGPDDGRSVWARTDISGLFRTLRCDSQILNAVGNDRLDGVFGDDSIVDPDSMDLGIDTAELQEFMFGGFCDDTVFLCEDELPLDARRVGSARGNDRLEGPLGSDVIDAPNAAQAVAGDTRSDPDVDLEADPHWEAVERHLKEGAARAAQRSEALRAAQDAKRLAQSVVSGQVVAHFSAPAVGQAMAQVAGAATGQAVGVERSGEITSFMAGRRDDAPMMSTLVGDTVPITACGSTGGMSGATTSLHDAAAVAPSAEGATDGATHGATERATVTSQPPLGTNSATTVATNQGADTGPDLDPSTEALARPMARVSFLAFHPKALSKRTSKALSSSADGPMGQLYTMDAGAARDGTPSGNPGASAAAEPSQWETEQAQEGEMTLQDFVSGEDVVLFQLAPSDLKQARIAIDHSGEVYHVRALVGDSVVASACLTCAVTRDDVMLQALPAA